MANKLRIKKEYIYFILSVGLPIIFFWWLWNLNPVEDYVGRWFSFLNPKRSQELEQRLSKYPDAKLLKLLKHGDGNKAGVAKAILGKRSNPQLFDEYLKRLNSKNKEVRIMARVLLQVDKARAIPVYMEQLRTLDTNSHEYRQTLAILVKLKYQPVYPYLVEYAKREDGWRNGSAYYLQEFGDPEAIPILKEQYEIAKKNKDTLEMTSISKAITHLEEIAVKKEGEAKTV